MNERENLFLKQGSFFMIVMFSLWGTQLLDTNAYYVNYLIILVVAAICYLNNSRCGRIKSFFCVKNSLVIYFSILFSFMIALANYEIWSKASIPGSFGPRFRSLYQLFLFLVFLIGGYIGFWNIFTALRENIDASEWKPKERSSTKIAAYYWCSFFLLLSTRLLLLFFCKYPGILTPDSIDQINQIITGDYSNHHPFYHTQIIRFFLYVGLKIFGNINAGVAFYGVCQIILTSFCFSLAVGTAAQLKAPTWLCIGSIGFYSLMPYHIVYSITVWKDIPFACFTLAFLVFFIRIIQNIGKRKPSLVGLCLSGLGVSLFRSNGFFAIVLLTIAFVLLWKLKHKDILVALVIMVCGSYILKYPVLETMNVRQPDIIESLSVPAQQIARVIKEGKTLKSTEQELLGKVVDLSQVSETYRPNISDPIKNLVRKTGNQEVLKTEIINYIKLYFDVGCRYPTSYIRAWIDETRGYWNSGYQYWIWSLDVYDNNINVFRTVRAERLNRMVDEYLWLFTNVQGFRPFISIGLFVWADMVMLFIALIRKDKLGVFVTLPVLCIVQSLLIATPVFSEFRYIYACFCMLPSVVLIVLRPKDYITS